MLNSFFKLFIGNLFGKIIGFLREIIIAGLYGTTAPVGAFRMAQSATLIPVNFFTSDSLNAAFIPLYNRYKKISFDKAQSLFWILKLILTLISIVISVGLFITASWWITLIAPGFNTEGHELTVLFVKIMAVGIPFYILSLLYSYLAIANDSYFLASIRPTIQSLGMICGVSFAYYFNNIALFAWGFTGAYILFFSLGIRELVKKDLFLFSFENCKEILNDFWIIMKPLLILPIILQGNIIIERIVSSYMGIEVVASVEYARFIIETGIVLLAVPLGLVGLSTFSSLNVKETKEKLLQIIPLVLILTVPTSLFLVIHSELIISLIFKRGAFTQDAVFLTQSVLIGLSIGFWAQAASYVMIRALNAHSRNREVVIFMAIALSANALFNILFYKMLGPITIGIGASIYGFILFIFTINALNITKALIVALLWLSVGSMIYYFINNFINFDGWIGVIISVFIFVFYWIGYVMVVPILRSSIMPLVMKLKGKK